jgi:molybdopterin synthase catalytic subunit
VPEDGDLILITPDALDAAALTWSVRRDSSGAIASFVGVVRDEHRGRRIHHLVYEAYPPMADKEMRGIASEIRSRWEVTAVVLAHRIGRLEIGEASVVIAVAAPHRKPALEACAFAIERIKQSVPIWKKEFSDEGEEWILENPSHG